MTPILQVLPSELLARIFACLPERQDVANARLACKVFHELSSPFLITDIFSLKDWTRSSASERSSNTHTFLAT